MASHSIQLGSIRLFNVLLLALFVFLSNSHTTWAEDKAQSWHVQRGWKAEDYFQDPQVVELCHAIEANDLEEIERLVKAGADVNTKGKDNTTLLLWAYPDNKLPRFKKLLELDADPNVVVEHAFILQDKQVMVPGDTMTYIAAGSSNPGFFQQVMKHGGNPQFRNRQHNETILHAVVRGNAPDVKENIELLLKRKVDLNHPGSSESNPAMVAASKGQFDIALLLLEAGTAPGMIQESWNMKLIHFALQSESAIRRKDKEKRADFDKLIQWLKDHGESVEEARADFARWKRWNEENSYEEYIKLLKQEVAERQVREKAAAEQKADLKSSEY